MKVTFIKYLQNQVLLISFILIAILSNQTKVHGQKINTNEALLNAKIDSIISILTLEEKIAMCHAQSKFSSAGVPRLGIPELWMSDGPHGIRPEMNWDNWDYANWTNDYVTAFPALTCLAATFNPDLSMQYGVSLGEEARYRKKDVLLGPGVNIYRTPLNGRNFEYLGEDPFLASEMVVPYIHGVQQNGVAACVKHYALNNQEHWRGHINVEVSDRALHEIYLPAFKAAIIEGQSWSIMGAYNKFRGEHCCHNQILLNDILKNKWAFDGVVVSDWAGTHDTNQAIHNGLDIEMGTPSNENISKRYPYNNNFLGLSFLEKINTGEVKEELLNDKVKRILRLMYRTTLNQNRPFGSINNNAHSNTAYKVATEGIVLLKNEDNLLPIDIYKNINIAIIGENAIKSMTIGGGSSELKVAYEISPIEGLKKHFKNANFRFSSGYNSSANKAENYRLKNEALSIAKESDIVFFIGGLNKNSSQDSEGSDRQQYNLPYNQDGLIDSISRVNKNIAVILISGNAISMPWLSNVKTVLQSWYLGSEAGNAIASVISGEVNPSGKLPFTFPKKLVDNGAHYYGELSYPGNGETQWYKEDILVGYRWNDTKKIKPNFAFGHGLSYASFDLSKINSDKKNYSATDSIKISCEIKNTGAVKGSEVVQVYIGKKNSKVKRALKELKGFKKISVLQGESKKIEIKIGVNKLAFYDEKKSNWNIEKGEYTVYVGNASDNIIKELKINII
ncbi:glycoside hydrolase family 3 C-terminal domain-containing protein [Flavobacteriaceae bacterium]|nr:glycoside hydrolase family 3 C-terminal domain-containing protein [bacterium]MDB4133717.1 glycoside hydrolase family 3 C-terminal domain-containing protein [Flavobacteriaceae bacterium]MDB4180073.1 glycoside hydrolase family 3 C-terminal domain-containing protein [Flavobacteriaceae bacterium]MDC0496801.1 glycoside hydrolase family 3 C-terminal domain-containing protein [Flavobacteriaceae bacterium]MDC0623274.1 glycoside hydrolase family 3 C-terminal domain-containing protein [Flavobacteriace